MQKLIHCTYECLDHVDRKQAPPRGVVLFTMFSNQEPGGRGPPWKYLSKILQGGPFPPGSWFGNIVNKKPPWGRGFFSINVRMSVYVIQYTSKRPQNLCFFCKNESFCLIHYTSEMQTLSIFHTPHTPSSARAALFALEVTELKEAHKKT